MKANRSIGTPIPFDELSAPARRALEDAGYVTLEKLAEITEQRVSGLHGMGPDALSVLRNTLSAHGLGFAGEDDDGECKEE